MGNISLYNRGIKERNIGNDESAMELFKKGYEKKDICCSYEYLNTLLYKTEDRKEQGKLFNEIRDLFTPLSKKAKVNKLSPDEKHIYALFFFTDVFVYKDERLWRKYEYEARDEGSKAAEEFIIRNEPSKDASLDIGQTIFSYKFNQHVDKAETLLDKYEKLVEEISREKLVEETSEAWLDKAEFDIIRSSDVLRNASGLLAVNTIENDEIKDEEDVWENYVPNQFKKSKNARDFLKGTSKISPENYDIIKKNELFYNLNRDEYYDMKNKYLEIINNTKLSKSAKDKMLESLEMAFDGILVRSISWKDTYSRMMYGNEYKYGLLTHLGHSKESIDNILNRFNDENYDKFKKLSKLFKLVYKDFFENEEDIYISDTTGNLDKGVVNKYDIEDLYLIMQNKLSTVSKDFRSFIKEMFDKHYLDLREIKNDSRTYRFYFDNVNEYRIRCGYKGDLGDVVSIFANAGISYMCQKSYGKGNKLVKNIPDPMFGILNRFFSLILIDGIKENGKYIQDLPYIMIHNGFKDIANLLYYLICFELECKVADNYKYYEYDFDDINKLYYEELLKAYDGKYIKIFKSNQSDWLDQSCFYDDNKMGSMIINILISFLLYKKYKENQEEFSNNFDEMVKGVRVNSFKETIEKFGIDLKDIGMVDEALDAMNDFIEEFESTIKN